MVVVLLTKGTNESNITERLGRLESSMIKEIGEFKVDSAKVMTDNLNSLNEKMEYRLTFLEKMAQNR